MKIKVQITLDSKGVAYWPEDTTLEYSQEDRVWYDVKNEVRGQATLIAFLYYQNYVESLHQSQSCAAGLSGSPKPSASGSPAIREGERSEPSAKWLKGEGSE